MSGPADPSAAPKAAANLPRRAYAAARRLALTSVYGALTSVRTSQPVAALTFDDGPHPEHTPVLLELLARHGALATHFVVGQSARRHPELIAAMRAAGHSVGSHSHSHRSLPRLAADEIRSEVVGGHGAVDGRGAPLFRPPYGHYDMTVAKAVRRAGLTCVFWSATVGDWRKREAAEMAAGLRKALKPGAIVLMHEALHTVAPEDEPDRTELFAALDTVLGELTGRMSFVTVPQLLAHGRPVRNLVERRGEDAFVESQVRTEERLRSLLAGPVG